MSARSWRPQKVARIESFRRRDCPAAGPSRAGTTDGRVALAAMEGREESPAGSPLGRGLVGDAPTLELLFWVGGDLWVLESQLAGAAASLARLGPSIAVTILYDGQH